MNRQLKGRRVPPLSQPYIPLPVGDLSLRDGRVLRYFALRSSHRSPQWAGPNGEIVEMLCWRGDDGMAVMASSDATQHGLLLHVSVSYTDRDPTWADIQAVRYGFYPAGVDVMMVLPQDADYVNLHPHCFHLWQTPVTWGLQ